MVALPGATTLWNRLSAGNFLGTTPAGGTLVPGYPQPQRIPGALSTDQILQQVWPQPWVGPGQLESDGCETPAMRAAYRVFYRSEPRVRAAVDGLVNSISELPLTISPADENSPRDREAAEFIGDAINAARGGSAGVVTTVLQPGVIDGWSVSEIKLKVADTGRWRGRWVVDHVRNLDTLTWLRLQLDVYNNIVGIVNLIRGVQDYQPSKVMVYTHNRLYNNPFGNTPMRAVYRAANLMQQVYQVWYVAMKAYGLPYMVGNVANPNQRAMLAAAMDEIRAGGWAVVNKDDDVRVLQLAGAAAASGFEAAIEKYSEDIFFAVRGTPMPFQGQNKKGDQRGDTKEAKTGSSDPNESRIARDVMEPFNKDGGLIDTLMRHHYPPDVGRPKAELARTDEEAVDKRLKSAVTMVKDLKLAVDPTPLFKLTQLTPGNPNDPLVKGMMAQPQQPGMPGAPLGPGGAAPSALPGVGPKPPQNGKPGAPNPMKPGPNGAGPKPGPQAAPAPQKPAQSTVAAPSSPGAASFTADEVTAAVDELLKEITTGG